LQSIQAVFVDRDGTIGGTGHFIHVNVINHDLDCLSKLRMNMDWI
jgi:hypothetical protein